MMRNLICYFLLLLLLASCKREKKPAVFQLLQSRETGLKFNNKLTATSKFNMFNYMYFYNGAGVAAADFNNDGLIDLFFASNQSQNKLFLNKGGLKFTDVTSEAAIPNDGGWSTGVSVVDINNDGMLDVYVCRVGQYEVLKGKNQLLICKQIKNGIPVFEDQAALYGLDFSGFSTQAAFFDYDLDGDLDMYLMNHSVHHNGTFGPRSTFLGTYHPLSGDKVYKNESGKYVDITKECGINSSAIGYGLGICVSDINLDGWPDLYIGNDFHENDYLYINQKNGTFKDELTERVMHTSQFSMGVDVADINNDAQPEIISMDMLPQDPYILKRSLGEDEYETFNMKVRYGYNHQYARNALQLNRGNTMFSEVGLYANVYATDWSWAPLWMDFDNDGLKDLFISNGIPKRLNDIDYVNYVSNDEVQQKIRDGNMQEKDMAVIDKFPQIKLPNKFYRNKGNVQFDDMADVIDNDQQTFSNGAVYADFDNDGDLDVVVNNIDDDAMLYRNTSNDEQQQQYVSVRLKGNSFNRNAIGAKVILFNSSGTVQLYEKNQVRGFQSSMEIPMHIGTTGAKVDSAILIWPNNTYQKIDFSNGGKIQTISFTNNLPAFNYSKFLLSFQNTTIPFTDITNETDLNYYHQENRFNEFNREQLLPHMLTTEGPAVAAGDVNGDGLEDLFIGSAKSYKAVLYLQTSTGKFRKSDQPALDNDSTYEDVDAVIVDVNNDKYPDLVVASGGNEYYVESEFLLSRVYINDGNGNLVRKKDAMEKMYFTASCIAATDFTGDGFVDLFIGARSVPWAYGQTPTSYLLKNDGTGKFTDITTACNKELSGIGMVTDAVWADTDNDGDTDLTISLQWGGIYTFINNKNRFERKTVTANSGWWNMIVPVDVDADGDLDFIAGNLGLNSRLTATNEQPVKMYYNDFDGNGNKEQIITYYLNNREILFANKAELEKQLPFIKKKFLYADDLAKASLKEILPSSKLKESQVYAANYFANVVLVNDGKHNYSVKPLPWQAQLTSYYTAAVINANNDNLPDLLLGGNFYENNIQMGRYDADFGTLLINQGNGQFAASTLNGVVVKGQVRHILPIKVGKKQAYLFIRNSDSVKLVSPFVKK